MDLRNLRMAVLVAVYSIGESRPGIQEEKDE